MRADHDTGVLTGGLAEPVTDAVARTYGVMARNPKDFVGLDDHLQVIAV